MNRICTIYRSPKKEGMYLFVDKADDLKPVPEALLTRFGKPERAMTLLLNAEKKLARVDAEKVMAALEEQGYYLQLPPKPDQLMRALHEKNSKIQG